MAGIDYWAIESEIAEILKANLSEVTVTLEEEMLFGLENTPWIGVYLESRTVPAKEQPIAMGWHARYELVAAIWIWVFALEQQTAFRQRDELLWQVEKILMQNRTLNDLVDAGWISGGRITSARAPQRYEKVAGASFLSGAEIKFTMRVTGSVTD